MNYSPHPPSESACRDTACRRREAFISIVCCSDSRSSTQHDIILLLHLLSSCSLRLPSTATLSRPARLLSQSPEPFAAAIAYSAGAGEKGWEGSGEGETKHVPGPVYMPHTHPSRLLPCLPSLLYSVLHNITDLGNGN